MKYNCSRESSGSRLPRATYAEQTADDREDYDGEDGDDDAVRRIRRSVLFRYQERGGGESSPAPCVEGGNDGFHGDGWMSVVDKETASAERGGRGVGGVVSWLELSLAMVRIVRWAVGCCARYEFAVGYYYCRRLAA